MIFAKKLLFVCLMATILNSCSIFGRNDYEQQYKSPCVDNGGPCKHIPINNFWLPAEYQYRVPTEA